MSSSTRFIGLALVGWVGLRAASLGMVPGGEAFAIDRPASLAKARSAGRDDKARIPAVAVTEFAPLEPVEPAPGAYPPSAYAAGGYPPPPYGAYPMAYAVPVAYAAGSSRAPQLVYAAAPAPYRDMGQRDLGQRNWGPPDSQSFSLSPAARYADAGASLDQWPLDQIARGGTPSASRRAQSTPAELIRKIPGIDRLSMSAWAMMRRDPGAPSLATNGQLGGSQAGARILWRYNRNLGVSVRSSAPIGGVQRTAELAAGVRYQPFARIPVAITAERRQSFGSDKGASAFAIFAEGGVYDRPIVARFNLDAYLQAGMVGVRDRAAFVDGSATLTRPVWRQLSAGVGMWGGAQPGLARFDAGPRLSWRIGRSMRVHVDYRHRFVGQAEPGSGPVLTLAGNF